MNYYYLNVHYGYGNKRLLNGDDAMFENFAHIEFKGNKFPSERSVKKELHRQGFAKKPIRSLGFFCYHEETA